MKVVYLFMVPDLAVASLAKEPIVREISMRECIDPGIRGVPTGKGVTPPSFYTDAGEAMLDAMGRWMRAGKPAPDIDRLKRRLFLMGSRWSLAHLAVLESWPKPRVKKSPRPRRTSPSG